VRLNGFIATHPVLDDVEIDEQKLPEYLTELAKRVDCNNVFASQVRPRARSPGLGHARIYLHPPLGAGQYRYHPQLTATRPLSDRGGRGRAGGPVVASAARKPRGGWEWAAVSDELAVELSTGPLGHRHYDQRHLYGALQRVWVALDVAHPGGLLADQQRHWRHGRDGCHVVQDRRRPAVTTASRSIRRERPARAPVSPRAAWLTVPRRGAAWPLTCGVPNHRQQIPPPERTVATRAIVYPLSSSAQVIRSNTGFNVTPGTRPLPGATAADGDTTLATPATFAGPTSNTQTGGYRQARCGQAAKRPSAATATCTTAHVHLLGVAGSKSTERFGHLPADGPRPPTGGIY
jgi:hypothetical protein